MAAPMPKRARTIPALLLGAALAALAFTGCQRKAIEELVGSELFALSLGKLEDQVDLFQLEGATLERKNRIYMRDGLFYLANGNAGKIMVLSSYGDLLFLLYDPRTNPAPAILGSVSADSGEVSTRGAVAFFFEDIGEIAVASDKTLYVEDGVAEANAVSDEPRGILLSRVVLRFDRKGKPLGYIGQEGIGGTPFPYIVGIHVTSKDQLVVVCRLPDAWQVFWYAREGELLYRTEVDGAHLPVATQEDVTSSLVSILPDLQNPLLYLVLHSYRKTDDAATQALSTMEVAFSRVYRLNLRTGAYEGYVELPKNPPRKERAALKTTEIPAPPRDVLGVSAGGFFSLLSFADPNLFALQILDPAGKLRAQRYLVIEDSELTFRDIHLSSTGIVYGLLCDSARARVTWWRSDLLQKGE